MDVAPCGETSYPARSEESKALTRTNWREINSSRRDCVALSDKGGEDRA
jgi:hypothetical protein